MVKKYLHIIFQKVKNTFWHLPKSIFFDYYYGHPSRKLFLIGITGTDGKTTTTNLVHQTLQSAGIRAGIISTLGAKIGDQDISIGLHTTSPDPSVVQKLLARMVSEGITHAVIEVTAHAIDQHRFYGCNFQIAGITNTSHEHLDDFMNMESYIKTKAKLLQNAQQAIINKDDQSFSQIILNSHKKYITFSLDQKSDYQAKEIVLTKEQVSFKVNRQLITSNSNYRYQIYNILLCLAIIDQLKIDKSILIQTVINFPLIRGRREIIKNKLKLNCIVDFAHTPAALETTLSSLKQTSTGRLIVIFGATGGRDPTKRPIMGNVVSKIADIAIITADDTRNELVENINKQIISGIDQNRLNKNQFVYYDVPRRQDAFNLAIKLAIPGDTVIACGKGHETTILHGKTEYPWSEGDAFRTAFRQKKL